MKNQILITGLLLFSLFILNGCKDDDESNYSGSGSVSSRYDEIFKRYDFSYDQSKVIPSEHVKIIGYIYNELSIDIFDSSYAYLGDKDKFSQYISNITDLNFIHKVKDSNMDIPISWVIEFPDASKEEVESLIIKLESQPEINTAHITSVYRTNIPNFEELLDTHLSNMERNYGFEIGRASCRERVYAPV